jgi:fructose-1,6-bisphosphatase I
MGLRLREYLRASTTPPLAKVLGSIALSSVRVGRANEAFAKGILATKAVAEVASEETERPLRGPGSLHVAMDPLDGSSNIDTNNPLGSIFGVYDSTLPAAGERLVAAAYVTYGPMLTLTFSTGKGVSRFAAAWKGRRWEFELLDERLTIPDAAGVYGIGGLRKDWIPPVREFVQGLEASGVKTRYCGTFVGDFNQVLKYGGIFAYPALVTKPEGKLRLLYESAPMAFIVQQAGGYASNGREGILEVEPRTLAETSPLYLGSASVVRKIEGMISSG